MIKSRKKVFEALFDDHPSNKFQLHHESTHSLPETKDIPLILKSVADILESLKVAWNFQHWTLWIGERCQRQSSKCNWWPKTRSVTASNPSEKRSNAEKVWGGDGSCLKIELKLKLNFRPTIKQCRMSLRDIDSTHHRCHYHKIWEIWTGNCYFLIKSIFYDQYAEYCDRFVECFLQNCHSRYDENHSERRRRFFSDWRTTKWTRWRRMISCVRSLIYPSLQTDAWFLFHLYFGAIIIRILLW